jgi:hypothetical protein
MGYHRARSLLFGETELRKVDIREFSLIHGEQAVCRTGVFIRGFTAELLIQINKSSI